ncbi:MAG: hypothetical protein CVU88_05480, partial [Firmicutes bacterium HGW-Firmicutes-13]
KYPHKGLFIIVPDMRGHGLSSQGSFGIDFCARDIYELLQHLKIDKANLVGVSMGGCIVQQFACDYKEKTDKLVIVDSFSGTDSLKARFNARLAAFLLKKLPKSSVLKMYYFEEQMLYTDIKHYRKIREKINNFNILGRLHEIKAPTLVLVGDLFGDRAINMAEQTADGIEESQFKVLPGGGDPSNLTLTEIFDKGVLEFIKS